MTHRAAEDILHEGALANLAHGEVDAGLDLRRGWCSSTLWTRTPRSSTCAAWPAPVTWSAPGARSRPASKLFREELGVEPSGALREAAEALPPRARPGGRAGVLAQLEAGEAAFAAGAVSAGLGILHQAVVDAEAGAEADLLGRALVTLGSALVHAARGSDEEGSAVLHRAIEVTSQSGDDPLAANAHRELGYVQSLRGSYARADTWLSRALELADPGSDERAWVLAVPGAARTDTGDHAAARELLTEASERARAAGAPRAEGWARSFLGRLHLLRGEATAGRVELGAAIDIARRHGWNSFVPWPEALLAEIDLDEGALDVAARGFDHAFAMGCQLGHPCWESLAARGLGPVAVASGDLPRAMELLTDAPRRCRRLPDSYRWIEAYALGALADVAVDAGLPDAGAAITELETIASRHGMPELATMAATLRTRRGEPGALDTARLLASELDSPVVHDRVTAAGAPAWARAVAGPGRLRAAGRRSDVRRSASSYCGRWVAAPRPPRLPRRRHHARDPGPRGDARAAG